MNKKKRAIIIAILTAIVALACGIIATVLHLRSRDAITRYEWIKMLCERENIEGYENTPFYSDVDETDKYYGFVQAAVERDIIPVTETFDGEEKSTGRFVALTAMRSIGRGRIRLALGLESDLEDDDFVDIAVDSDLISKEKLSKTMSAEDCKEILDKLDKLYYTAFLKDDYEHIEYTDKVIEISGDALTDYASDYTTMTIGSDNTSIRVDDVVVFEDKNTHARVARKVTGVSENGEYQLAVPSIDEVVKELEVSDIVDITAEDIFNYYDSPETASVINTAFFNTPHAYESKGFSVKVETDSTSGNNLLKISIIDNETGKKCEIPNSIKLEDYEKYKGEFSINRITIASMIDYDDGELNYVDIAMDMDMHGEAGIESEVEERIPLFEVPIPLGTTGAVSIILKLNLLIDINGAITVAADIPVTYDIGYDSALGGIKKQSNISVENGELLIDAKGELSAEAEGLLKMLYTVNIVDAEIRVGAIAEAKTEVRDTGMICGDVEAKAPVVRFALCDDDDADSLLGKFYDADRLETTLDAKAKQFHFHHEIYPDGKEAFVEECTYKGPEHKTAEERIEEKIDERDRFTPDKDGLFTYTTKYGIINAITCPTFKFDYPDNWMITEEYFDPGNGIIEEVVLEDQRGAQIIYMHYTELGNGGNTMISGETRKVAESKFVPSYPAGTDTDMSYLGAFAVARVCYGNTDEETNYDDYGVIPEKNLGSFEDVMGSDGIYELLSFEYPRAKYCFVANPPLDGWTEQEREEMIGILSSFRSAD